MKPNHYARKKRQLKALVEKLKYFMDSQNEDSLHQFKKLVEKIKNLVQELAHAISIVGLKKILGTAAIFIGISCANPTFAQSFGPPQTNPFGLTSTVSGSHPALADLDGDGDLDLLVGKYGDGHIEYYENTGTMADPEFGAPQMNPFGLDSSYLHYGFYFPSFVDMDDDGDIDILFGGNSGGYLPWGAVLYFENIGDSLNSQFDVPQSNPFGLVDVDSFSRPTFADLDGDGDSDLFDGIGLKYFENIGSSSYPQFSPPQESPFGLVPQPNFYNPSFADLDNDGDMDLLFGGYYSNFQYYENTGDPLNPQFANPQFNPFGLISTGGMATPAISDLDGDGDSDLLVGTFYPPSTYIWFFENTTITSVTDLNQNNILKLFPNPADNRVNIETGDIIKKIEIHNAMGERVMLIRNNVAQVSLAGLEPGLYAIKITLDNNNCIVRKILKK